MKPYWIVYWPARPGIGELERWRIDYPESLQGASAAELVAWAQGRLARGDSPAQPLKLNFANPVAPLESEWTDTTLGEFAAGRVSFAKGQHLEL